MPDPRDLQNAYVGFAENPTGFAGSPAESRDYVVMYYGHNRHLKRGNDGLVMLTSKGRYPMAYDEALALAKEYTQSYSCTTFLMRIHKKISLVSPVQVTDFNGVL